MKLSEVYEAFGKHLFDKVLEDVQETKLFEMAISRQRYQEISEGLFAQIAENWILIRYQLRYGTSRNLITHWSYELMAHLDRVQRLHLKAGDRERALRQVLIDQFEWDDPENVFRMVRAKMRQEQIFDNDKIKEVCEEFISEYDYLFEVMTQDEIDVEQYVNDLLELE